MPAQKKPSSTRIAFRRFLVSILVIVIAAIAATEWHESPAHGVGSAVADLEHEFASQTTSAKVTIPPIPKTGLTMAILRARIVAYAESQLGYTTDPPDSYCNKYSAYWDAGNTDCGPGLLDEEWCADFAAWTWQKAGAYVVYQFINGDLNSSAASFYEWGANLGTWHPVGSGYIPQPGDAAVYGLDLNTLVAQHVAIVTSYTPGDKGPNVINGDGDKRSFSNVEAENDQVAADTSGAASGAPLSGYVSPSLPTY